MWLLFQLNKKKFIFYIFPVSTYSVSRTINVPISNNDLSHPNPPLSHYEKNRRIPRTRNQLPDSVSATHDMKIPQGESNVFTKLALGNCMETLMKTSRQSLPRQFLSANITRADDFGGSSCSMGTSIPHKSVQNLRREQSIGIPIPPRRNNINMLDDHISSSVSPPSGRFSPNSLLYGSPTMATMCGSPTTSSPVHMGYLDVYGSSGSGKVSRAASPQPLSVQVGGATGCGDYRLGFKFVLCFL